MYDDGLEWLLELLNSNSLLSHALRCRRGFSKQIVVSVEKGIMPPPVTATGAPISSIADYGFTDTAERGSRGMIRGKPLPKRPAAQLRISTQVGAKPILSTLRALDNTGGSDARSNHGPVPSSGLKRAGASYRGRLSPLQPKNDGESADCSVADGALIQGDLGP